MICLILVCGQTVWPKYVRDVAVPLGFAWPWWEVRLRGAVPLGTAKHGRKRGVSLVSGIIGCIMQICLLLVCGQTVWPKYVRDVAVPLGFARP